MTAPSSTFGDGLPFVLDHDLELPPPDPVRPRVAVYGDSYTCTRGGEGPRGWPARAAAACGVETVNQAVSGAGYVDVGDTPSTFPYAATIWPVQGADVAIVMGSQNDQAQNPVACGLAATVTYGALRATNPGIELIVVGPFWPWDNPPPNLLAVRDQIRAAAFAAGAVWLDPIAGRWLTATPGLYGDDGWHPNLAGQRVIADRVIPHLALAAIAAASP